MKLCITHTSIFFICFQQIDLVKDMNAEKPTNGVKKLSPCDVEALRKCLEENEGDYVKCQAQIEAFRSSCSLKKSSSSSSDETSS